MKNTYRLIVFALVLVSGSVLAQPTTTSKGENFIKQIDGKIDKAKISIDNSLKDPAGSKVAENWFLKGYVYTEIAKSEVFLKATPNAAREALTAIERCKKLDTDNLLVSDCINVLFDLSTLFYNTGINAYNKGLADNNNSADLSLALVNFDWFFETIETLGNDQSIVNHLIEHNKISKNNVYVYAGYCAYKTGDNEKAKSYFNKVVLLNVSLTEAKTVGVPLGYIYYTDLLMGLGDTVTAKKVIEQGAKLYPDNADVLMTAIDIYSKSKNAEGMAEFLQLAVQKNPTDLKMLIILAGAYNSIAKSYQSKGYQGTSIEYRDKALAMYEKALALKPTDQKSLFTINYNIGILYYNPAVIIYRKKDEANKQEYEYLFRKSLPYLEKAHELDPDNKNVMNMLMKVYQTLGETDKAVNIENKLYK